MYFKTTRLFVSVLFLLLFANVAFGFQSNENIQLITNSEINLRIDLQYFDFRGKDKSKGTDDVIDAVEDGVEDFFESYVVDGDGEKEFSVQTSKIKLEPLSVEHLIIVSVFGTASYHVDGKGVDPVTGVDDLGKDVPGRLEKLLFEFKTIHVGPNEDALDVSLIPHFSFELDNCQSFREIYVPDTY